MKFRVEGTKVVILKYRVYELTKVAMPNIQHKGIESLRQT